MTSVLIVGVSTRAAAESAARAGFEVTALDAFGDLDQHVSVRALSMQRDFGVRFSAGAAARAARAEACDAVAYLSSFENHPVAVRTLAAGRTLWGNPPEVLQRVRHPLLVARVFRRRGLTVPAVRLAHSAAERDAAGGAEQRRWLAKPRASGGGHGIGPAVSAPGSANRLPRGWYLQEQIDGTPASVVFVAAGRSAVPLGISRQLVGEPAFGAHGYRYCGSILASAGDPQLAHDRALVAGARALVAAVAEELGVVGVNGIDFVAREGVPYPLEVNPRYSASMELVECAYGISVFGVHASACAAGALPTFDVTRARQSARTVGKAIVFARRDVVAGDTRDWLGDCTVRDVPWPGERILRDRPVCTIFAEGRDAAACHAALVRRAERIYQQLTAWEREVA
jgi:predicted ATP-grasp superfamily ATP-dependent carboligase